MAEARVNPEGLLKGRVAVVTGASRGIGEAIAARLAMEGAKVAVSARTAEEGDSKVPGSLAGTAARIRRAGGEAVAIRADLAAPGDRERLIAEAVAAFGPVDILVNNAGLNFYVQVPDFGEKRLRLMLEVQVVAPFHLAQLVLPSMRERRQGWIVNISSNASGHPAQPYRGIHGTTVYGMCKAALERFTTGLASEVHRDGVAVNVVSPELVATPGMEFHGLINDAVKHRLQPVEVIAEAVLRLASGDPKTMTGRIDRAAPLLEALGVAPAALI
ncbi:MAG: SDR family NAD(P)-dependent oxidoreductase [Caulobacteraceae bacterium]|nr:SDR family NAD(P)-dependent oxidoreductase [Caulobacteraceae bacterium]